MRQNILVPLVVVALVLFLVAGLAQTVFGQWSNDPTVNTPVVTQLHTQPDPKLCPDGTGGTIIVWQRLSYAGGYSDCKIYAQRLNAAGVPQWTTNGAAICTATSNQWSPALVGDGLGGAIITWGDLRSGSSDIYAQHVNSSGVAQWTTDGVAICTATGSQGGPQLVSDGAGGAIITWVDERSSQFSYDIYAQRVNSSGAVQWTTNGVAICTATYYQEDPQLVSDGSGGAIITWEDERGGAAGVDIYAQRVNSSGVPQWITNGVAVCTASNDQRSPRLASDGSGGVIIAWGDWRNFNSDIYAQRVSSSGVPQWTTNGIAICAAPDNQGGPQLVSDVSGGAIIAWQDSRGSCIFAQRVNVAGVVQWTTDGIALSATPGGYCHQLVGDGTGGAIITWHDWRSGPAHIYAQRVNVSGVVQWTTSGVAISTADGSQARPELVSDGAGGAIIAWNDWRNGSSGVYAQNVNRNGQLGMSAPSVIANGQFEQGTSNWTMYSAAPNGISFSTVAGGPSGSYAKVHINATSNNMQVYQTYFPLTAGKRYRLGFDAYSPTSRKVFVTVHKHGAPYGSYGFGEWIQLGPSWTHYERQFTAGGFSGTTSDTRLRFYFVYACGAGDDYYFDNVSLAQMLAKSGEEQIAEQPTTFRLDQNYPNPFNPTTTIKFSVGTYGHTSLRVYDVLGREVAILVDEVRDAGVYEAVFDATSLSSGMYFYKLESGNLVQTKKMIIMK